METLLFNQYFTTRKESSEKNLASLPLNLLHLASYLKSKNMECKIYELGIFNPKNTIVENNRLRFGISNEEIIKIINKEKPKIIGLGCMYSRHYIDIIYTARLIKKIDSSIKVVTGGNHATAFWEMIIKEPSFDFIVRGEGELTFYELCENILAGEKDFSRIKGIAYKNNGIIVKTPDRELVANLDDLPAIDYSFLDLKKYTGGNKSPYIMRTPLIGIISSRGCPGRCVYCTVRAVWGRTWRGKSPKRIVDEIETLHKNYGIKEFSFLDDSASVNKVRWNAICDEIINRGLDIKWSTPNGIAHWTLDRPTLLKMKKAGCYRITFGIESGNPEIRNFLGKPYPLSQAQELIQYANKIGMWTICTNILGFPYETRKQMEDTVEFAKKSGTDFAAFYILCPMPTSDVYKYFKDEGLLDFDFIFNDNIFNEEKYEEMYKTLNDEGTPTKNFTPAEIKEIQTEAYRSFIIYRAFTFLNPLRVVRKIHSMEDLKYTFRLGFTGVKLLVKSFYENTTQTLLRG